MLDANLCYAKSKITEVESAKDWGNIMLSRLQKPTNLFFALLFCFLFIGPSLARAEDSPDKDEYDFSWLDPDKKIYVVQNRKFTNGQRAELSVGGGFGIGQPYRSATVIVPRFTYYFNESFAISALATLASNSTNGNFDELRSLTSVIPEVRDVKSFVGGSVMYLPFYAKFNIFNQIIYMDWDFELGLDSVTSEIDLNYSSTGNSNVTSASYTGFHWGTGMKFFLNRNFAVRLDFLSLMYSAPGALNGVISSNNNSYTSNYLTLGLSYTF
jgi:outer membrane beta-barrel protein